MTQTGSIGNNEAVLNAGPSGSGDTTVAPQGGPESWSELRANPDIQFEEIPLAPPPPPAPPEPPSEPGWFAQMLQGFFEFLGAIFGPIGQLIGASWFVLQWVLLAAVVAFVLYLIARTVGPLSGRNVKAKKPVSICRFSHSSSGLLQ